MKENRIRLAVVQYSACVCLCVRADFVGPFLKHKHRRFLSVRVARGPKTRDQRGAFWRQRPSQGAFFLFRPLSAIVAGVPVRRQNICNYSRPTFSCLCQKELDSCTRPENGKINVLSKRRAVFLLKRSAVPYLRSLFD